MIHEDKLEGYADIGDSIYERRTSERKFDQHCIGRVLSGVGRFFCTIETPKGELLKKTIWITYDGRRGNQVMPSSDLCISQNHFSASYIRIHGIGYYPNSNLTFDKVKAKNLWVHDIATYTPSNEKYLARDLSVTIPGGPFRKYFRFVADLQKMLDRRSAAMQRKEELTNQIHKDKEEKEAQKATHMKPAAKQGQLKFDPAYEIFRCYECTKTPAFFYHLYADGEISGIIVVHKATGEVRQHCPNQTTASSLDIINKNGMTEVTPIPNVVITALIKEGVIKVPMTAVAKSNEESVESNVGAEAVDEAVVAEQQRIEQEQREREEREARQEELKRIEEEIAESERALQKALKENRDASIMWRSEYEARETPGLNPQQEKARISHLYDNIPVVIEGGPGTGKTTVLVQRLNFLLSKDALYTHQNNLTEEQKKRLTGGDSEERNWLFLAPNQMLLDYLKNSMVRVGLQPNSDVNTKTIASFRSDMMLEYGLTNPAKRGPFLEYKPSGSDKGRVLIVHPVEAIADFGKFFVSNIRDAVAQLSVLNTSQYSWNNIAQRIKAYCKSAEKVVRFKDLYQLFTDIQINLYDSIADIEKELREDIQHVAHIVKINVLHDERLYSNIIELFDEWQKISIVPENIEVNESELEEIIEDDEESATRNLDYEKMLLIHLRRLLPKVGLRQYISVVFSEREQKLYSLVEKYVKDCTLDRIGELKLFSKKYSQLCKGVESNIFGQLVRTYKVYRKHIVEHGSEYYDMDYLRQIVKKDNNKRLHIDEEDLLIGMVNNMARSLYAQSPRMFMQLKSQKYIDAYKENVRYVIGVDEATDYSLLDYYMIASFRHFEFSSLSVCGDLMQGLNNNGIRSWHELESVGLKNIDITVLDTSYRQSPTLLAMSKRMYRDEMGIDAPYDSSREIATYDAFPLRFVRNDEGEKITWIANRIVEVYRAKDDEMPSVAIFIGDNENIDSFVEEISDSDVLAGIRVKNGATTTEKKSVRVYHLSDVKGMEFEVAIFHNIDKAIAQDNSGLMRRHLYVGISRAASHLAATFCQEEGNEDVLKYFDFKATHW